MIIGVTGLNANDNPGSGIAVVRALRDEFGDKLKVIGLSYEPLEPGIYLSDMVDQTYQIPTPTAGAAALQARLEYIHQKETLDLIIPNFDSELYNFIKIAPFLQAIGIKTFLPTTEQLAARDKINLNKFCAEYGFKTPANYKLNNVDDLEKASEELGFPLVIKGKFYDAYVNYTLDLARQSFYKLSATWGLPVIAQQFIKGTEINVAGLGDGKGNAISVIPMRKLYITDKGKAWAGITIEDVELIELARKFTSVTQWKGGFELELIRNAEGELFIIEVNPRFPAWVYLTAGAGQNQPAALVKMAMGEIVPPFTAYRLGKMFIRYSWDQLIDVIDFQKFAAFGELCLSPKN